MRDRYLICIGLVVFLGVVTLPFTYNLAAGKNSDAPLLPLPENEKQCVAPTAYMRSSHMRLLRQWRENAVRRNERHYRSQDGRLFETSLTRTCLAQCHTSKTEFCDRCHGYMGVPEPFCMDCHIDPSQTQGAGQ